MTGLRRFSLGNAAEVIDLPYPLEWSPADLTGLTLNINDQDGNELMAADDATLYTEATLSVDSLRYSRDITLTEEDGALAIGDLIRIEGILGYENHTVKGWDADNLTAELEEYIDRDFEAGSTVNRLSATIEVDISDTDVFPAGKQLVLIWTPTGTGGVITEIAVVSSYRQVDIAGLSLELQDVYPRAYKALKEPRDRLARVAARARSDIRKQLLLVDEEFEINNIRDQDAILPAVAAQCAVLWTLNGDEQLEDERKMYLSQVAAEIDTLSKLSELWVDSDSDLVDDPLEKREHPPIFHKGW